MKYRAILADPPWPQQMMGRYKRDPLLARALPYPAMSLMEICALPVEKMADDGCHLWLWTTNAFLEAGFQVMRAWGFKYLAPITWIKPSGCGAWFVHRTQTLLFGYRSPLKMESRYKPTVLATGLPKRHSQKPDDFYSMIEAVSQTPRLEMFARQKREGWDSWGNEVESDVQLLAA